MAFPRSQRFAEKETCAPSPTAYYLPSPIDENNCNVWGKPCTFDHQCSQCLAYGKSHDQNRNDKSSDQVASCMNQRSYSRSCDVNTKENIFCVQKNNDVSNCSKLKKILNPKLTEPKAPSFMTRPRHSIHNCLANSTDETEKETLSTSHFNKNSLSRHSLKKKSVNLGKENKLRSHKNVEDVLSPFRVEISSNLQDNRQLNVSYIIRNESIEKLDDKIQADDTPTKPTTSPVTIPNRLGNITDDMKESASCLKCEDNTLHPIYQPNANLEVGSSDKIILEKDDFLQKEYLNNFDETKLSNVKTNNLENTPFNDIILPENFVENTASVLKIVGGESGLNNGTDKVEKTQKSNYLSPDIENHVVFLIAEEFIDDEYDSYLNDLTPEMKDIKHRDTAATNLFEIYKSLVLNMRKPNVNVPKRKVVLKVKQQSGFRRGVKTKETTKTLQNGKKAGKHTNILWSEIVRAAISDLKGEFKNEIYKETKEKVHAIMSNLAKVLLKAEDSIDKSCERTTVALINKLEKIVTN